MTEYHWTKYSHTTILTEREATRQAKKLGMSLGRFYELLRRMF